MNSLKTFLFLGTLTLIFILLGDLVAAEMGIFATFILSTFANIIAYFYVDKMILKFYKASEIDSNSVSTLSPLVKSLADKASIPMPRIYLIKDKTANICAMGRHPLKGKIIFTTGLLESLNENELKSVIAYTLCQIREKDTLFNSAVAAIATNFSELANKKMWLFIFGLGNKNEVPKINPIAMNIFGSFAGMLIKIAISRSRVFEVDRLSTELIENPIFLVQALEKLEMEKHKTFFLNAETHPSTAHLFIINPLKEKKLRRFFNVHPTTYERIDRLKAVPVEVGEKV